MRLMRVERGNPVRVRAVMAWSADCEEGSILWREKDDPTSERRWIERSQETRAWKVAPPLPVLDNWPDTGRCPDPKGG